jgi:hypothetical protein
MSQTYDVENRRRASTEREPSGWAVGWAAFAAIMMMVQGCWWITAGIIALFNNEFYVVGAEYVFQFDITTWGWIHLVVGAVLLGAGAALFSGATWARIVGVMVAVLAMIAAFAWLPWYPISAVLFIAISVAVIWSLTAHPTDFKRI